MSEDANTETKIECPYRFEFIDKVPEGVHPNHHDRFSMIESFGENTTMYYQTDKDSMPSCIFYHAPTRTRWRLFFSPSEKSGVMDADFMTALIKAHEQGMF